MSAASWPARRRPLLIGVTGPIGCGKSTVAQMLAEYGGAAIDADVLARRATEPGRATLPRIRARFGDLVFDSAGILDRATLARVVFEDPAALADLEAIVHPEVRRMLDEEVAAASSAEAPFVVIEAIKLVEGGLAERCDEVWLIECDRTTQVERLTARGVAQDDAERRIEAQGEHLADRLAERLAGFHRPPLVRRLSNDGALAETRDSVEDALADAIEADRA